MKIGHRLVGSAIALLVAASLGPACGSDGSSEGTSGGGGKGGKGGDQPDPSGDGGNGGDGGEGGQNEPGGGGSGGKGGSSSKGGGGTGGKGGGGAGGAGGKGGAGGTKDAGMPPKDATTSGGGMCKDLYPGCPRIECYCTKCDKGKAHLKAIYADATIKKAADCEFKGGINANNGATLSAACGLGPGTANGWTSGPPSPEMGATNIITNLGVDCQGACPDTAACPDNTSMLLSKDVGL